MCREKKGARGKLSHLFKAKEDVEFADIVPRLRKGDSAVLCEHLTREQCAELNSIAKPEEIEISSETSDRFEGLLQQERLFQFMDTCTLGGGSSRPFFPEGTKGNSAISVVASSISSPKRTLLDESGKSTPLTMTVLNQMQNLTIENTSSASRRMTALTNEITHYYNTQTLNDVQKKEKVKECLESLGKDLIAASVPLAAIMNYGSSINGFGSNSKKNKSDIDVTIKVSPHFEQGNPEAILRRVAEILRRTGGGNHAQFENNRLPLVKADYRGWKIDLCYDDEDAVVDAKLLRAYGIWEDRLFVLGFFVKKWAKAFGICSGSRGFFKSYHWIILVINCLQKIGRRTKKGKNINRVLPYIQTEFWTGQARDRPWRHFETTVARNWSTNASSVGELFLHFLEFYENFNFKTEAIHILSRGRVSRRKNEMADAVCIRDPFYRGHLGYRHLSHNDKRRYDRHYSERNSAKKVTQQNLTIIQETIRMTASQIRGYLHDGKPMTSPVLKELFNL